MNLEYVGQNQDSGLYAKKSGVILFKPKLLGKKHGSEEEGEVSISENSFN